MVSINFLVSFPGLVGFLYGVIPLQPTDGPFIDGRVLMADMNGDGYGDYLDGQIMVEGLDDAPVGQVPLGILVRQGPESADFFWHVLDNAQDVDGFRISAGGTVLASLPVTASSYRFMFDSREQSRDVRISAVDANGLEIGASVRRIQPYGQGFEMRGAVYGPNQLELIWDSPAVDFLVWRDGEVYQLASGHSFVDLDVSPGVTHEYFVTLDVLTGGERNAEYLNSLEGQQRRTNAVSIGPGDTSTPVDPDGPVIPGGLGLRPDIPADLSGIVYSSTALELFWDSDPSRSQRYIVLANGVEVGRRAGASLFIEGLNPDTRYDFTVQPADPDTAAQTTAARISLTTRH